MEYYINIKNNKINTILSIFMISTLILAPLCVSSNIFAQDDFNSAIHTISQAKV